MIFIYFSEAVTAHREHSGKEHKHTHVVSSSLLIICALLHVSFAIKSLKEEMNRRRTLADIILAGEKRFRVALEAQVRQMSPVTYC